VIRRIDHIGDPVGLAFLESPETDGDAVLARVREYLGEKLRLVKAEVSHDEITVEIECRGWLVFAEQEKFAEALVALKHAREFGAGGAEILVAMGRCAAGLERNASAIAYYEEALKLEPRNFVARRALSALGRKPATKVKEAGAVRSRRD
jgi:hypothetical protein